MCTVILILNFLWVAIIWTISKFSLCENVLCVCVSSGVCVGGRDRETSGTHSLRSQTVDHLSRLATPSFVSLLPHWVVEHCIGRVLEYACFTLVLTGHGQTSRALHWEGVGYISADRAQTAMH